MTRMPEKGSSDLGGLHALLDEVRLLHVGLTTEHGPLVVSTAGVRLGDVPDSVRRLSATRGGAH